MKSWSLVAALGVVSLSSCGLSPEKEAVIAKARSIHEFPVSRKALVASLGLGGQRGDRVQGGIRGGYGLSTETWHHPTGLTTTAYDMGYVGQKAITRESIDVVLPGLSAMPNPPPPRKSFNRFLVKDGKKVVFESDESSNDLPHVQ